MTRRPFAACLPIALALALVCMADRPPGLEIKGDGFHQPYRVVRLKAANVPENSALLWKIKPEANVERIDCPPGEFRFVAPPGFYEVQLFAVRQDGQEVKAQETARVVEIGKPGQDGPSARPEPAPGGKGTEGAPKGPGGRRGALPAVGKLIVGNSLCTGTVVGPRRADGRWDILTACHCLADGPNQGSFTLRDGQKMAVRVVVRAPGPDIGWCVTEDANLAGLPFAMLSSTAPAPGTKVWHQGYGEQLPGNREEGKVLSGPDAKGMLSMLLSVSNGDSGAGVFRVDNDELVATVCCTLRTKARVQMWGGSSLTAKELRPGVTETAIQAPGDCLRVPFLLQN